MTSKAVCPVPNLISVPVTVQLSFSSDLNAQDIRPSPTATPRDGSGVDFEDDESREECRMLAGTCAELDSRGSRT